VPDPDIEHRAEVGVVPAPIRELHRGTSTTPRNVDCHRVSSLH
jgi:hypothetical protein